MKATRIAIAAVMLCACSMAPAGASVGGAWAVDGTLKTWFIVKGQETERESSYNTDVYAFLSGGKFLMSGGLDGLWREHDGEFAVDLNIGQIESYFEDFFAGEGVQVDVDVVRARVKGTESESGDRIQGNFVLKLDLWFIDFDLPGRIKANFKFDGTRE